LRAFCLRFCARTHEARASVSTTHKLARIVPFMLARSPAFVDAGPQRCEEQQRQRSVAVLKRRAGALSSQVNPMVAFAGKRPPSVLSLEMNQGQEMPSEEE
jgi:hypothetical protein